MTSFVSFGLPSPSSGPPLFFFWFPWPLHSVAPQEDGLYW